MSVIAILTAVRATVIASRNETEQAEAISWLQKAADALHATPRRACAVPTTPSPDDADLPGQWLPNKGEKGTADTATVWGAYEAALNGLNPTSGQLEIATIEFVGRTPGFDFGFSGTHCSEGVQQAGTDPVQDYRLSPLRTQLLMLRFVDEGDVIASMSVVKGDP
jgi:hypothetical protein